MEKTGKKGGLKSEKIADFLKRKMKEATEEFVLPSGLLCKMEYFSAKKARMAQNIALSGQGESASLNEEMLHSAMVAECCSFRVNESSDWEKLIAEDVAGMVAGMDFMVLQGKLSGVSLEEEK